MKAYIYGDGRAVIYYKINNGCPYIIAQSPLSCPERYLCVKYGKDKGLGYNMGHVSLLSWYCLAQRDRKTKLRKETDLFFYLPQDSLALVLWVSY